MTEYFDNVVGDDLAKAYNEGYEQGKRDMKSVNDCKALYKDVSPLEVVSFYSPNSDFNDGVNFILEKLDAIPVADVEPVVRCKDCIHRVKGVWSKCIGRKPDEFCSDGESKWKV